MAADPTKIGKRRFLYNIDVLIEDESNGRALEKLLHMLNHNEIADYRIQSGIELGNLIEEALNQHARKIPLDNLPSGKIKDKPLATEQKDSAANRMGAISTVQSRQCTCPNEHYQTDGREAQCALSNFER